MVWQIATATGWSVSYILWGVSWQTLLLMLADAPRYVRAAAPRKPKKDTLSLFRSLLNSNEYETR